MEISEKFTVHRSGKNELFNLQNECKSCGWKGQQWYAYDNYMHYNCREERNNHKCEPEKPLEYK